MQYLHGAAESSNKMQAVLSHYIAHHLSSALRKTGFQSPSCVQCQVWTSSTFRHKTARDLNHPDILGGGRTSTVQHINPCFFRRGSRLASVLQARPRGVRSGADRTWGRGLAGQGGSQGRTRILTPWASTSPARVPAAAGVKRVAVCKGRALNSALAPDT